MSRTVRSRNQIGLNKADGPASQISNLTQLSQVTRRITRKAKMDQTRSITTITKHTFIYKGQFNIYFIVFICICEHNLFYCFLLKELYPFQPLLWLTTVAKI